MQVVICGPNLRDQSKGDFHAHAAGCHDLVRHARREPMYREGWTVEASSVREVVENVYSDFIFHNDCDPWDQFVGDIHFFPCCQLPMESNETHFKQIANVSRADGEALADEEFTEETILGALSETLPEQVIESASTDELNDYAVAYLNGMQRAFTAKIEALKSEISGPHKSRQSRR